MYMFLLRENLPMIWAIQFLIKDVLNNKKVHVPQPVLHLVNS
jgi:hypothetical protein